MAKLPFLLFRSLRLSHNSTCLCIEKCVRQSGLSHFSLFMAGILHPSRAPPTPHIGVAGGVGGEGN